MASQPFPAIPATLDSKDPVGADTLFLIVSSSKPFASPVILRMPQDESINFTFDDRINQWLLTYTKPLIDGNAQADRAPTTAALRYRSRLSDRDWRSEWRQTPWNPPRPAHRPPCSM